MIGRRVCEKPNRHRRLARFRVSRILGYRYKNGSGSGSPTRLYRRWTRVRGIHMREPNIPASNPATVKPASSLGQCSPVPMGETTISLRPAFFARDSPCAICGGKDGGRTCYLMPARSTTCMRFGGGDLRRAKDFQSSLRFASGLHSGTRSSVLTLCVWIRGPSKTSGAWPWLPSRCRAQETKTPGLWRFLRAWRGAGLA